MQKITIFLLKQKEVFSLWVAILGLWFLPYFTKPLISYCFQKLEIQNYFLQLFSPYVLALGIILSLIVFIEFTLVKNPKKESS